MAETMKNEGTSTRGTRKTQALAARLDGWLCRL